MGTSAALCALPPLLLPLLLCSLAAIARAAVSPDASPVTAKWDQFPTTGAVPSPRAFFTGDVDDARGTYSIYAGGAIYIYIFFSFLEFFSLSRFFMFIIVFLVCASACSMHRACVSSCSASVSLSLSLYLATVVSIHFFSLKNSFSVASHFVFRRGSARRWQSFQRLGALISRLPESQNLHANLPIRKLKAGSCHSLITAVFWP